MSLITGYQEAGEHEKEEEEVDLKIFFAFVMLFKAALLGNHFDQHTQKRISFGYFYIVKPPVMFWHL